MDGGRTLIMVSNGWVNNQHGDTIDSFDEVCRINNGQVKGFEHLVGSKTTIWARWIGDDSQLSLHAGARRKLMYGGRSKPDVVSEWEPLPVTLIDEIRLHTPGIKHATTGLATLVYLLHEYSVIHLFNWFPTGQWQRHYWHDDNIPKHRQCCPSHRPDLEREYVEWLRDQGRVVLVED